MIHFRAFFFAPLVLSALCGCSDARSLDGDRELNAPPSAHVRIVSLDYCADQFVLRFVPEHQIVAVSQDARKYFSYMRAAYPSVPSVRATAEDVLALRPTIVVRSYGGGPGVNRFMQRAGVGVVQLGYPSTLDEVRHNVTEVATQLHAEEEGRKVVAEFDARLDRLKQAGTSLGTLYTTPGGVTTGPGSLVHEMMLAAGLVNYESRPGWRDLPLERLIAEQPERLAKATFGDPRRHVDPWTRSRHPRARALVETIPGVEFEGAWTSCGAWFLMDAIEVMAGLTGASAQVGNGATDWAKVSLPEFLRKSSTHAPGQSNDTAAVSAHE